MTEPRLSIAGVSKSFGATRALREVSLDVMPGEVVAIVGENGAGKSTLLKILSGAERPDAGALWLDGEPFAPRTPHDARRFGVATIYQELALAPDLDVAANVWLGMERTRFGFLRPRDERRGVREVLAWLRHADLHPGVLVRDLAPAARQLVEVARVLAFEARVVILDEPTSSLTRDDAERLLTLLRELRDRGRAILYVSHFLEEVERVADRYVVLRDGQAAATGRTNQTTRSELICQMIGRDLGDLYPSSPTQIGQTLLEVRDLAGRKLPRGVSFKVREGEILGIFGLVGAGRTETLRCLFGLDDRTGGTMIVGGRDLTRSGPHQMVASGVGLVSEDRKQEGLALTLSIEENLTLGALDLYARWGWLRLRKRRQAVADWLDRLAVRLRSPTQRAGELSGGNQQKVALGRLLHHGVNVLLLDEPTRGIDLASKAALYRLLAELARQGKGIVFVSSYLPELLGVCTTLAVMSRGLLSDPRPVEQWTEQEVMAMATAGEMVA